MSRLKKITTDGFANLLSIAGLAVAGVAATVAAIVCVFAITAACAPLDGVEPDGPRPVDQPKVEERSSYAISAHTITVEGTEYLCIVYDGDGVWCEHRGGVGDG